MIDIEKYREKRLAYQRAYVAKAKPAYAAFIKCYPLDPTSLEDEIWADICGYEGEYQVSNYSRVKSLSGDFQKFSSRSFAAFIWRLLCSSTANLNILAHTFWQRERSYPIPKISLPLIISTASNLIASLEIWSGRQNPRTPNMRSTLEL